MAWWVEFEVVSRYSLCAAFLNVQVSYQAKRETIAVFFQYRRCVWLACAVLVRSNLVFDMLLLKLCCITNRHFEVVTSSKDEKYVNFQCI